MQKVLAADEAENLSEAVLVTTADGGKIETKYVTAGTYVIREVSTLPGYLLDTKERYFTVDEEGFILSRIPRADLWMKTVQSLIQRH